jgi:hypothetical protein
MKESMMSKFLLIALALLAISMMPSSLTSSNVLAQADSPTAVPTNVCIHENMYYTLGDFIQVDAGPSTYAVLRCLYASGQMQWIALKRSELNTSTNGGFDPIFHMAEE